MAQKAVGLTAAGASIIMDYLTVENSIVLAIKPENARRIYSREKSYELRKRAPSKLVRLAFLYETDDVRAITGLVLFRDVFTYSLKHLWDKMDKRKRRNLNFRGYFGDSNNGTALEIEEAFKFERPIELDTIKQIDSGFKPPQNFLYVGKNRGLARRLRLELVHFLWRSSKPIRLERLRQEECAEFSSLVQEIIGRDYDEIDQSFADHLVESTTLRYDEFGYFTKSKNVYSVRLKGRKIGYTTITEKIGGSVKTGPTIFYKRDRNKGFGQMLRYHIENLYLLQGFRKVYCTCPATNIQAYKYLMKAGYRVEAHLPRQYSSGRDEVIFGKLLRTNPKRSYKMNRTKRAITRVTSRVAEPMEFRRFLIKNFPLFYMQIDDSFVVSLLKALRRPDQRGYYGKPKRSFCGYADDKLTSVIIGAPKRGGSVKLTAVVMSEDFDSFARLMSAVERHYRKAGKRKLYVTIPIFDSFAVTSFQGLGYSSEGVLSEPYSEGVDLLSLGKFI